MSDQNPHTSGDQTFEFLSDQPLATDDELREARFGHQDIARVLANIVARCPGPFTIGLFGRWGSGKSTIANKLRSDLRRQKIPTVIFDVWKHQDDALRRTFLRECVAQLKSQDFDAIDPAFELDERLDQSVQHTEGQPALEIPWRAVGTGLATFGGVLALAVLVDWAADGLHYTHMLWQWVVGLIGAAGFVGAAIILLKTVKYLADMTQFMLSSFVSSKAVTYTVDKFSDPRDFEEQFSKILVALKVSRVAIVFDNMDRVTHEKAVQVLTTIKTFLEPDDQSVPDKQVVFLIPCDAQAIREHVQAVYLKDLQAEDQEAFSPDEFLRKFFSSVLWIPDFIPSELESYTRDLLKATKVADLANDKVAWIITKAYRENPRQIKQFINVLLSNYLLVRERQGKGRDYPENFLAENTPQLARFLLLNELFPECMGRVREARVATIEDVLTDGAFQGDPSFRAFVSDTSTDFRVEDIREFFTLRRSEQVKHFAGIEDFFVSLEDQEQESAESFLRDIEGFDSRAAELGQAIRQRLAATSNPFALAKSIATLILALDSNGQRLDETSYREIHGHLGNGAAQYLYIMPMEALARQVMEPYPSYRASLCRQLSEILEDVRSEPRRFSTTDAHLQGIVRLTLNHWDWFASQAEKLKQLYGERFAGQPWFLDELLKADELTQKSVVTSVLINGVVETVSPPDLESRVLAEKLRGISAMPRDHYNSETYQAILTRLQSLIAYENGHAFDDSRRETKVYLQGVVTETLTSLMPEVGQQSDEQARNQMGSDLLAGANSVPDWDSRSIFIEAMLIAQPLATGQVAADMQNFLTAYFQNASSSSVDATVTDLPAAAGLLSDSPYAGILGERAMGDQQLFQHLYVHLSPEHQQQWLNTLYQRDLPRYLAVLASLGNEVPDLRQACANLLATLESRVSVGDAPLLEALNRMRCAGDATTLTRYSSVIQRDMQSTDFGVQAEGAAALKSDICLDEQAKRDIVKNVFEWVRQPGLMDKYQPSAVETIVDLSQLLNKDEKSELVQFLFEELVRKGADVARINFGFNQLEKMKPTYPDRKTNFDDLQARWRGEQDQSILEALIEGLRRLKPGKTAARNRDYWAWVENPT